MFRNNFRLWDSVLLLFPCKCHTCKTAFLFKQLRWHICFTSDLQMKCLLWVAPASFQQISAPTFWSGATEGYNHKSAYTEGHVLCCQGKNTCKTQCFGAKMVVVMLNGRITKPGLLRPRRVGGFSAMWLRSVAVWDIPVIPSPQSGQQM